jgi:TldD protein
VLQYLERCRSVFVTLRGGYRPRLHHCRCAFEGGLVLECGRTQMYSGPPKDVQRLPEAPEPADVAAIGRCLRVISSSLGTRVTLCYSGRCSVRLTLGTTLRPELRWSASWALTGNIQGIQGRVIPVGWSGPGQGLEALSREGRAELLAKEIEMINRAEETPAGEFPTVLAPPAAALLLHEAVGHFAEASADPTIDLRHRLGCRIASELFNVRDDPLVSGGRAAYASDDDEVASLAPTEIVRDGVLVAQLHSLASARAIGAGPSANGRAASGWNPPIPRMSNLMCRAGEASEEELIVHAVNGLYVHRLAEGISSGLSVKGRIVLAEWIARGQRTGRFVSGGTVRERIGLLTRVVELGRDSAFSKNALCGKAGQLLFDVGTSAPAMRFTALRIE